MRKFNPEPLPLTALNTVRLPSQSKYISVYKFKQNKINSLKNAYVINQPKATERHYSHNY